MTLEAPTSFNCLFPACRACDYVYIDYVRRSRSSSCRSLRPINCQTYITLHYWRLFLDSVSATYMMLLQHTMLLLVIYLNVCCEGCNGGLGDNFAVYGRSTRAKLHFWWWRYQGMAAVLCAEWVYILLADLHTRTCASLALSLPEFFIIISCVRGMLFTDLRVKPLPSGLADRPCTAEAISVCVIFNIPDSNSFSLFCKFFAYCFLQAVNSSLCSRSIVFTLYMTLSCVCPDVCSVPVAAHPRSELCWTGLWPATMAVNKYTDLLIDLLTVGRR